jgi:hypothetical protein
MSATGQEQLFITAGLAEKGKIVTMEKECNEGR